MSGPTTEIRWSVAQQGQHQLAVEVSLRRGPAFAEEPIASAVVDGRRLAQDYIDSDQVTDLLRTWLADEPKTWQPGGPAEKVDPAVSWRDDDRVTEWGRFLGRLLVERVVGTRLDAVVHSGANGADGADGPTVRLLFALRGAVARRLPVELLLWPHRGVLPGPIAQQRGLSVLREAEPSADVGRTEGPPGQPRIVVAGVASDFVDASAWQEMADAIDGHEPRDFRSRVGPGPTDRPKDALKGLGARSGDVAILWGHGDRQRGDESEVWSTPGGSAIAADIVSALGGRYGAAFLAMCYSASEGDHGERSVLTRLVSGGVRFGVGFQGRPATSAVTEAIRAFVGSLRTDHRPGAEALGAYELALYRVRTETADGLGVARQIIAEVDPRLTAGRRRRSPLYRDGGSTGAPRVLRAYRTAGQLLVTRIDGLGLVRLPLPVDPLDFTMQLDGRVLRLGHSLPGLRTDLEEAIKRWGGLHDLEVNLDRAPRPDPEWGLKSAMLDAVVAELERILGEPRPAAVDDLVCGARCKDWGSPPLMSVVHVQSGAVICSLGPSPEAIRVEVLFPGTERVDRAALADDVHRGRLPVQDATKINWQTVDRAVAGDRASLERLIDDQLAVLRDWWAQRSLHRDPGPLPDRCLGLPSLTRLAAGNSDPI